MHIHFVGIGGIGISALAKHFLVSGEKVTGSDLAENEIIDELKERGAEITKEHFKENISKEVDLVVYSPAVPKNNIELKRARKLDLSIKSYPRALGDLTDNFFTIAVSGTHGKSTTTAMAALVLIEGGLDPTVIVGTKLKEFGNSNYRRGESNYLLIEADEWSGSLLNYRPDIIILTNLELEHVDYYKDFNQLIKTFNRYLNNLKGSGPVIINGECPNLNKLELDENVVKFSKSERHAENLKNNISVPGKHNLENALAAYKLGKVLNIQEKQIIEALSSYKGAWRRFEEKEVTVSGRSHKLVLDYAHHPTELEVTLETARGKFSDQKITAIFQPHQHQRSLHLSDQFIEVFKKSTVDRLWVTDIYSVPGREREEIKKKISSKKLVKAADTPGVSYIEGDIKEIGEKIINNLQKGEVIVIIGAGDIYKLENSLKGPSI